MSCRSGAVGCALGDGRTRLYGARDPALAGEANPAVHRCPSSRRAPPHDGSIGGCALHLTAGGTLPRTAPDGRSLGLTSQYPYLRKCQLYFFTCSGQKLWSHPQIPSFSHYLHPNGQEIFFVICSKIHVEVLLSTISFLGTVVEV